MDKYIFLVLFSAFILMVSPSCVETMGKDMSSQHARKSHQEMIDILTDVKVRLNNQQNMFSTGSKIAFVDSVIAANPGNPSVLVPAMFRKAEALLQYGDEAGAIQVYKALLPHAGVLQPSSQQVLLTSLGTAFLRLGERNNCLDNHSADACIMPIAGRGVHSDQTGSGQAAKVFYECLKRFPDNLDARWLLNIAHMTLGEYPEKVPSEFLIPGLDADSEYKVKAFEDVAAHLGLNVDNRAGGAIVEDFDNDGYLDLATSGWDLEEPIHYFRNNGDGTFSDRSAESGLNQLTGGLNMVHADYNNDGFADILVLRGAWQGQDGFGEQPNSLLKNNGDGTFTDVTTISGVLSFKPTQTATWNDFNRDGWLDLFVGNETADPKRPYACELYINNQDGTFTDVAALAGVEVNRFVKGVASGDFDNDGWPDIFVSTQDGSPKLLFRNMGAKDGVPVFGDVAHQAGIHARGQTFGTWFWDYDNDGWSDIFMANYDFGKPLSFYAAREALSPSNDMEGKMYLYHNNQDGTFSEVAQQMGLNKLAFAMGNNFGDMDNDGWLDFYLGTGNPSYQSLLPNKFFRNMGGKKFVDITNSSRTGHLQKGHGVAFADMDNDGDQDIYAEMGGAYRGDHYPSSFFLNPGQNENNWICVKLEGVSSNSAAIGARLEVKFREGGAQRTVFRDVNEGGSFGCSPFRREIGVGKAAVIDEIRIFWPVTGKVQTVKNLRPNQFIRIKEGQDGYETLALKTLDFKIKGTKAPMCKPGDTIPASF